MLPGVVATFRDLQRHIAPLAAGLVEETGGGLVVVAESVGDDPGGHLEQLLPDGGTAGPLGELNDQIGPAWDARTAVTDAPAPAPSAAPGQPNSAQ